MEELPAYKKSIYQRKENIDKHEEVVSNGPVE